MVNERALLTKVTRQPEKLLPIAGRLLQLVNRLRRRAAGVGATRLITMINDFAALRPSRRDWALAGTASMLNWVFDIGCLAACCAVFDVRVGAAALLISYTAGKAAAGLSPLPESIGLVETTLILGLATAGAAAPAAVAAVITYRLISLGIVAVIGWGILAIQRCRPTGTNADLDTPLRSGRCTPAGAVAVPDRTRRHHSPSRHQPLRHQHFPHLTERRSLGSHISPRPPRRDQSRPPGHSDRAQAAPQVRCRGGAVRGGPGRRAQRRR